MKFPVFLALFLTSSAWAGTVVFDTQKLTYDDTWAFKQRQNQYTDIPDGTVVYASNFSQEDAAKQSFRSNMKGVHFYNCELCGVTIPPGNFVHDFFHDSGCPQ